ncbi:helix-turn-helix domain-containing protein [Paenibacillus elgii]|uniref:helix-turn-helix domain-containing protein n=1 Tax=Paenibacillus elgii TaxID=189691 RepID=UPI000248CA10|nr:helix-turn-helix transcriptional regulator [Paenibacillus elgii]
MLFCGKEARKTIPTFDGAVAAYRNKRNWTLEDMAAYKGYSASYHGKIERGEFDPPLKYVINMSNALGFDIYNSLVAHNGRSFRRSVAPPTNAQELSEKEMVDLLNKSQYSISALFKFFAEYCYTENYKSENAGNVTKLCVLTSIPEERILEIANSYNFHYRVSLPDALRICSVLNKRFHEIFAITTTDMADKMAANIAITVENYIEKHREKVRRFSEVDDQLTEDEVKYLEEMLIVYRTLKLRPQDD